MTSLSHVVCCVTCVHR